MNGHTKERFEIVYFVVQTYPLFKTCGITFDKRRADALVFLIKKLTGQEGKIIQFTREELEELNY